MGRDRDEEREASRRDEQSRLRRSGEASHPGAEGFDMSGFGRNFEERRGDPPRHEPTGYQGRRGGAPPYRQEFGPRDAAGQPGGPFGRHDERGGAYGASGGWGQGGMGGHGREGHGQSGFGAGGFPSRRAEDPRIGRGSPRGYDPEYDVREDRRETFAAFGPDQEEARSGFAGFGPHGYGSPFADRRDERPHFGEEIGPGGYGFGHGYGGPGAYRPEFGPRGLAAPAARGPRSREERPRGKPPRNYQRPDARVREEICDLIAFDSPIDASDVEIEVKDGVVSLTGTIGSREEKRALEELAEAIWGVKDVHNELRVARLEQASARSADAHARGGEPARPIGEAAAVTEQHRTGGTSGPSVMTEGVSPPRR